MRSVTEALVEDNYDLARNIAHSHSRSRPVTEWDDIESAALAGLLEAADRFDPTQGFKFATYASWRINGAIVDELRRLHGRRMPNGVLNPAARYSNVSLEALIEANADHHDAGADGSYLACLADDDADPALEVADAGEIEGAKRLLQLLPERDQDLVDMYFMRGLTMSEIGDYLGVTESRISQRVKAVRERLAALAVRHRLAA